ncbi:MAG: peptidase MA family metallohydrolase [bacterium]
MDDSLIIEMLQQRYNNSKVVLIVIFFVFGISFAQFSYFGKNKVQTRDYQFQSFETKHFKILFYPGGEVPAEFAAKAAEDFYTKISRDLDTDLDIKVPVIIYLSPGQFYETNVITDLLDEGVGGFSELIRNRVVIPFNGSYADFYRVIGHELTHIFQFQMFYRSNLAALFGSVNEFRVPQWIMEGFAEFQSGWVTVNSEIFMRDLVLSGRLISLVDLNDNYGYLAYREGESFFHYVANKYGREKVYEFINTLRRRRNLEAAFQAVFGLSQKKMSEGWEMWLKMLYWPQIVKVKSFDGVAERLTDHQQDGSVYNTAPAISPSGARIAMISDRAEYVDLYIISALNGQVLRRLVRGGRSGGFERLHLVRSGVAWSPDEKTVAVVATGRGKDNITLVDVENGRVVRRICGNLDAIYSPIFSSDGQRLVFVGVKNGFSDIYVVDVNGSTLKKLTFDMYEDRDPAFSPTGDTIVFVSDRPEPGEEWIPGNYAVWLMDKQGVMVRLTEQRRFFGSPLFTSSGEYLLWVAADSSSQNIYVFSLKEGRVVRRTNFLGEVYHLSLSKNDRKLAFAYFSNLGWDIAMIFDPLEKIPFETLSTDVVLDTIRFNRSGLDFEKVKPVGFSLALDYLAGAASYTSGARGGFAGTVYLEMSDILGNHRFAVYSDLYGDILNSNLILQYWLLPYRIDYGFTVFQIFDVPYYCPGYFAVERINRGGGGVISYPLDRFTRFEAELLGSGSDIGIWRYNEIGGGWDEVAREREWLFYGKGALVFDNTYWPDFFGPVRGVRTRFEFGSTFPGISRRVYQMVTGDFRYYLRLGRRFVFASQVFSAMGFGRSDSFYLDGEYVRGYNGGEFYDAQGPGLGLFSFELRYPLIDRLKLAFPLPIDIRGVRGLAFIDGGIVFRDSMRIWDGERFQDLKLGFGAGLRIPLWFFYVKLDFAKPLSFTKNKGWKFLFGLGYDF